MTAPGISFTILSGGLGVSPPSPSGTICVVGCSSAGSANVVSGPYANPTNITTDYGYGPGPELLARLVNAGIQPIFVKTPSTTPGSAGSVTHTGTGASVMSVTGTPLDRYSVVVTVTRTGTVGSDPEPGFTLSLDGGLTVSPEIRVPSSGNYAVPHTGMTLSFTIAGTVAGDTYTFSTTPPLWSGTDITNAIAALKADNTASHVAGLVYVVGPMSATDAGTFNTALAGFLAAKKPIRGIGETRDFNNGETEGQWITSIENDYVTFASDLISIAAGPGLVPSALSGVNFRRSAAGWGLIQRLGLITISTSAAEVDLGALPDIQTVYHEESGTPGLDADRFVTLTNIQGLNGFFITAPRVMSSPTSDFNEIQFGRIMDEAVRITYNFFVQRLNSKVRIDKTTGHILEKDARALETGNDRKLEGGLVNTGDASDAQTVVSRIDNILSTKTLTVTVKILPPGYLEHIAVTMTFQNPALG